MIFINCALLFAACLGWLFVGILVWVLNTSPNPPMPPSPDVNEDQITPRTNTWMQQRIRYQRQEINALHWVIDDQCREIARLKSSTEPK